MIQAGSTARKLAGLGAMALLAVTDLIAVPLTVSWVEGRVERQGGTSWVRLEIDDRVESTEAVRLEGGAFLELATGNSRIMISSPGTYLPDSLLKAAAAAPARRGDLIARLARSMAPRKAEASGASGGIRAAEAAGTEELWYSEADDARDLLEEAKRAVAEGGYAEGARDFLEAADSLDGEERDSALFGYAFCLAAEGRLVQAIKLLREHPFAGYWSVKRALLLARLDLDSGAFEEARALLESVLREASISPEELDAVKAMLAESKGR
jgi:hypothetical protein